MSNSHIIIDSTSLAPLATELAQIGQSLVKLSKKFKRLTISQAVPVVKVSPKNDPEMFTEEFIKTVRQSRRDFEKGDFLNYSKFRESLDLE